MTNRFQAAAKMSLQQDECKVFSCLTKVSFHNFPSITPAYGGKWNDSNYNKNAIFYSMCESDHTLTDLISKSIANIPHIPHIFTITDNQFHHFHPLCSPCSIYKMRIKFI